MRHLALSLFVIFILAGCDRSQSADGPERASETSETSAADAVVPVPFKASDYLVVERYADEDAPFPSYRTHHIAVSPDGYELKGTREGFHAEGKSGWSWTVGEELVEGARDCSCEALQGGSCSPDATIMMARLRSADESAGWMPPIYEAGTKDAAFWSTKSASAWMQGNILFTSVCLARATCGKPETTVCDSRAVDLGGDAPVEVPLETFGGAPVAELLKSELGKLDEESQQYEALAKAVEDGVEPQLAEVRPSFDGKIQRRWVVPSRYAIYDDWSSDRVSAWDDAAAGGPLEIYARIPRPVSIFSPTLEGELVGWTDGELAPAP